MNTHQVEFYKNKKYDENYFTLIISTINYCNYTCEYCCENCNIKTTDFKQINFDVLYSFITNIVYKNITSQNKKLKLSLYGGEPTLHPDLYDFCEKIFNFDKNIYIEIFTNFSQSLLFYNKFLDINAKLIITYHYIDTLDTISFFEKFKKLLFNHIQNNIVLNIMYEQKYAQQNILLFNNLNQFLTKEHLTIIMPILLKLVRSTNIYESIYDKIHIELFNSIVSCIKNTFDPYYIIKYSDNTYEYINDEELELKNLNFNKWQCSAGNTSLYIDVDGFIFKCISYALKQIEQCKKMYFDTIFTCKELNFTKTICINNCCSDYDTNKINIFNKKDNIYV